MGKQLHLKNNNNNMSVAARIKELNITLPAFQDAVGTYRKCIRDGNLMYTSTHFGMDSEGKTIPGKVGTPEQAANYKGTQQVHSPEAAKQMARNAGLRLLSTLSHHLDGNLDRVEQVVKLVGIVKGLERVLAAVASEQQSLVIW